MTSDEVERRVRKLTDVDYTADIGPTPHLEFVPKLFDINGKQVGLSGVFLVSYDEEGRIAAFTETERSYASASELLADEMWPDIKQQLVDSIRATISAELK